MGQKEVVAANLRQLMDRAKERGDLELATQNALAKVAKKASGEKVGQRTIGRILSLEQEPGVEVLQAIAQAYELQGWQLLIPNLDPRNPPLLKEATETEREFWRSFDELQEKIKALEKEKARASKEASRRSARSAANVGGPQSRHPSAKKVAVAGKARPATAKAK